jgi:hypothetical protein
MCLSSIARNSSNSHMPVLYIGVTKQVTARKGGIILETGDVYDRQQTETDSP